MYFGARAGVLITWQWRPGGCNECRVVDTESFILRRCSMSREIGTQFCCALFCSYTVDSRYSAVQYCTILCTVQQVCRQNFGQTSNSRTTAIYRPSHRGWLSSRWVIGKKVTMYLSLFRIHVMYLPIFYRVALLVLRQSYDSKSAPVPMK